MHHHITRPAPCPRTTTGSANTAVPSGPLPLDGRRESTIAYQRLANELPLGLHRALRQMLDSLVAAADGRPIGMFSDLIVEVTASRVLVGPSSDDPVVYGIQRRFTVRATQTCHGCGRNGRARKDLGGRVRCAQCATPGLLLHAIDQVMKQAGPLRESRRSSDSRELPPLLRPVFRTYVEHHARNTLDRVDEIDHEIFAGWLKLIRGLASELRHGTPVPA
jgi:hypothetical protein